VLLEARPGGAGLNPRRQRRSVDLEHLVEQFQIDRDDPGEAIAARRLDATDDACAASEGDHGRAR